MKLYISNHGDLILIPTRNKPPKTAKQSLRHVLQQSETTGNRHEVVSKKEPIHLWEKDDRTFLYCKEDYEIHHLGGDEEHGVQKVQKGTRELKHEMEHDPWTNELKVVID